MLPGIEANKNIQGIYRRRIILEASDNNVIAGVEDDFHHFTILLRHDGSHLTSVEGRAIRTPWTTCPEATAKLSELIGLPVSTKAARFDDEIGRHLHCTHLMELALFAIAQAARGGRRQYDIALPYSEPKIEAQMPSPLRLELLRDDAAYLAWELTGDIITSPTAFAGHNVRKLGAWAAEHCDDDTYEALKIMRRCLLVSIGRTEVRQPQTASELSSRIGACYAFKPERLKQSFRTSNNVIDFTTQPNALLSKLK